MKVSKALKAKTEKMTNKELLDQALLFKKLCNLVPTKRGDVKTLDALLNECEKRKLL